MRRHASMNRTYRLVWSSTRQIWVAAAEIARGRRGKASSKRARPRTLRCRKIDTAGAGSARHNGRLRRYRALAASILLSAFGPLPALGATLTWTGGGSTDNWSDIGNWSGSFPSAGDTLVFNGSTRLSPFNDVNVKADLMFGPGAGAFTLVGNQDLPTTGITNLSSNMQTIDGTYFVRVTDTQTWDAGTAGLTINSKLYMDFWLPSGKTLTVTGSGDTYLNGAISFSELPDSYGSLTKTGSGTLFLNGSNSYWGETTVYDGTVVNGTGGGLVDNSPFAVNGGTLDLNDFDLTMSALWGTGGIVDLGSANLTVNQGGYAGTITGTGGLLKTTAGTLSLAGNNTYTGGTTLNAGTLRVSSDSNLGAAGGGLTFDGGTLQTTASFTTTRTTTLNAGGGRFNTNAATTLTHRGDITGNGVLTKVGDGTLILRGRNDYSGGTTVSGGTLQGDGQSLQGNILNNAAVIFNQEADGLYSGEMSGSGSLTKIGSGVLELTGTNTYSGGTTVSAGFLKGDTGSLQGDILNNATVVFDQATDGTYAGAMSGSGSLAKLGAGTLTLSGTSAYTGAISVDSGTLLINGSIASATTINSGGTLGGSGQVGSVTVNSGGTLAPGNSPGLLTIAGDLNLASGSVTRMEIDGTTRGTEYDAIDVSGTATLDGTLDLVFGYVPVSGDRYRLINASTLVLAGDPTTGFATITSNLGDALLATPVIDPTTFDILIELAQQSYVQVAGAGLTSNQRAVGSALDRFSTSGQAADLIAALNTLRASELPAAMDRLSGVEHGQAIRLAQRSSLRFSRLLAARGQYLGSRPAADTFGFGFGTGPGADTFGFGQAPLQLSYNGELRDLLGFAGQGTGAPRFSGRSGFWITPTTGAGEVEGDGNAAGFDYDYAGLYAGFDRWLSDTLLLGTAFGYTRSDSDLRSGAQDVDSLEAALYGRYAVGADYLATSLGYGRHAVDSRRTIAIGSQRWQAEGDYRIDSLSLDLEAGRAFIPQAGTQLTPFVGLGYARHDREDFTERGAGAAALRLDDEALESIRSRLGLRLNQALAPLAGCPLALEAEAAWLHEFGDHTASLDARFDQAPTAPFRVDGPETDSDHLQASLGLSAALSRASRLFVGYQGEYAGSNREHALSANWQMHW